MTPAEEIAALLRQACVGHPAAEIPWPHQLLHDAADTIDALQAKLEDYVWAVELSSVIAEENERLAEKLAEAEAEVKRLGNSLDINVDAHIHLEDRLTEELRVAKSKLCVAESMLDTFKHPMKCPFCEHSSAWSYSEDGGKNIRCLLCTENDLREKLTRANAELKEHEDEQWCFHQDHKHGNAYRTLEQETAELRKRLEAAIASDLNPEMDYLHPGAKEQLQREMKILDDLEAAQNENAELRKRVEEAERDKVRLDWMEEFIQTGVIETAFEMDGGIHLTLSTVGDHEEKAYREQKSLREAIEAALASGKTSDV